MSSQDLLPELQKFYTFKLRAVCKPGLSCLKVTMPLVNETLNSLTYYMQKQLSFP